MEKNIFIQLPADVVVSLNNYCGPEAATADEKGIAGRSDYIIIIIIVPAEDLRIDNNRINSPMVSVVVIYYFFSFWLAV